ncbi:MAG: helix-turn-helix domain-containing protein [Nitrospinae bacterium]|nr:helix-turn-helix domain-containing protein [Nitrospinota bacterium]
MTLKKMTSKLKNFKDRLQYLIGEVKPYAWCKQIGIEKGLFQYYWQKEKIPKYENLIKIRNHTGCSLDWLMTGDGEPYPDRIEDMETTTNELLSQIDGQMDKLDRMVSRLKQIKADAESLKKNR